MKKNIHHSLLYLLLAITFTACYSDDSTDAKSDASKLSVKENPIEDTYVTDAWMQFTLSAPTFEQTAEERDITYRWSINGEVVSSEQTLSHVFEESGVYNLLLIASNQEDVYTKTFTVNVRYAYGVGLYALALLKDSVIISYEPDVMFNSVNAGWEFQQDILKKNNIHYSFNAKPVDFTFATSSDASAPAHMYLVLDQPISLYRVNANTMNILLEIETSGHLVQAIKPHYSLSGMWYLNQDLIIQNKFARLGYRQTFITNTEQQTMDTEFGSMSLFTDFVTVLTSGTNENYTLFFDNANSRLLGWGTTQTPRYKEFLTGSFSDLKAISLQLAQSKADVLGVFQHNTTNELSVIWFHAASDGESIKHRQVANASLSADGVFRTAPIRNLLFYTSGNQVFVYNITSQNALPTTPQFTCGSSSEVISDMWISEDENRIYIATNDSSQELQGSLYCFSIQDYTQIWEQKNVTGEIKKIDYRTR